MGIKPSIGAHLATLNLFREVDGTLEITVSSAPGALREYDKGKVGTHERLIHYVEGLIIEAAERMKARHNASN